MGEISQAEKQTASHMASIIRHHWGLRAGKRVGVDEAVLRSWALGTSYPTTVYFRKLQEAYEAINETKRRAAKTYSFRVYSHV